MTKPTAITLPIIPPASGQLKDEGAAGGVPGAGEGDVGCGDNEGNGWSSSGSSMGGGWGAVGDVSFL
jgi:hypothetical protein